MIAIRRHVTEERPRFEFMAAAPEYARDAEGVLQGVHATWTERAADALDVSSEPLAQQWCEDLSGTLTRLGDAPPTTLDPRPDPVIGARAREVAAARKAEEQAAEEAEQRRRAEERVRERMADLATAARTARLAAAAAARLGKV